MLKPTAVSCTIDQPENEYMEEERDPDLPLECIFVALYSKFTKHFWHTYKFFFAWANRFNSNLKIISTREENSLFIHQNYDPFYLHFGILYPMQTGVNSQLLRVNKSKKQSRKLNSFFSSTTTEVQTLFST